MPGERTKLLSTDDLYVFRAAAKTLNFSRVSSAGLHLSQPAVSLAMKKLEDKLGVRLFEQAGRTKRLTIAGKALAELVGDFLDGWERMPERLHAALTSEVSGTVRIGAGEGAILYLLPPAIERFRRRHPEVDVVIRNQPTRDTLGELRTGEIDFGVRSLPRTPDWAAHRPWRTFERVVITAKRCPFPRGKRLTLEAIAGHPLVMPWREAASRQAIERAMTDAGLEYRVALEAGGWEIIKRYVALGLGIGVVPSYCLQPADRRLLATRPASHLFGSDAYGIVTRRNRPLGAAARALLNMLDPSFGA